MATKKKLSEWQRWKKRAPKVPDITCPDIDWIMGYLEERIQHEKKTYNQRSHNTVVRRLEQLRKANEKLRESGEYWYSIAKQHLSNLD